MRHLLTIRQVPLLSALAVATLLGSVTSASAEEKVRCEIRSILGLQAKGRIDKRLAFLKRQLSKPPFSAFRKLDLLETKELRIPQGRELRTKLPTRKVLRLTFKEKLLVKNQVRLRMHLSIKPPRAVGFLPGTLFSIVDGGTLLIAGDKHRGGTLIVGITCRSL
jgi:hypothetical protein